MLPYPFGRLIRFLILGCLCATSSAGYAQATRTWVSGVGDDANPCSRTAPCKTFAGAISKTAAGGEINAIDSGGFGAVTITKSITIDGGPFLASVLASGTSGININAAATDKVILRNIEINGAGTGNKGINFIAGGRLHVTNVKIYGFTQHGIDFSPAGNADLFITDSHIHNNSSAAVASAPGAGVTTSVTVSRSYLENNFRGMNIRDGASAAITQSTVANNVQEGLYVSGASRVASLIADNTLVFRNGTAGVAADGVQGQIHIGQMTVSKNDFGLRKTNGGAIFSFGNNRVVGNPGGDGVPTAVVPQM